MIAILAVVVFFQINGEKIPVNEGAYGDGVFYREVGRFFLDDIESAGYNLVQLTRILPFALLNLSFSAFHIVKDNEGLQNGMIMWQLLYLALAIYWYFRIVKKLRLKLALMTLGFILLFFNFAWLKGIWYHPFSPDLFAFALGMGQANYFLRYEKFKLGMVSILGAFVSPLLLLSGLLMLFLPGDKLPLFEGERSKSLLPFGLSVGILILIAGLGWGVWGWADHSWIDQTSHLLALVAIPPLIVFAAKQNPVNWDLAVKQLKKRTKTDRLSKGIMGLVGILLVLVMLSGQNESLGITRFLQELGKGSFRFPWDFIWSYSIHWGLPAILTLVFLLRFYQEMARLGWAVVFIFSLGLVFMIFFKVSALAAWVPIWVVILLKALKRYRWSNKDLILSGVLSLVLSMAWMPINSHKLIVFLGQKNRAFASSLEVQKWAIHHAEWTALYSYAICGGFILLIGYWLYTRRKRYMRVMSN